MQMQMKDGSYCFCFLFYYSLLPSEISGFRCEVDENCAVLGYYAASDGSFLPTFRDNRSVQSSRTIFKGQTFDR